jgi:predicted Zn-dependent peptidase
MRSLAGIALALLVAALEAGCAAQRQPSAPRGASAIRELLPNGVRIVVEPRSTGDVVALQLWVKVGGRDEGSNELGLAHYLEHMLSRGTERRPRAVISEAVEGVGGRMSARSSLEYTYHEVLLPAAHTALGIDVLADMAVNAVLDEADVEREKRAVLEEMRFTGERSSQLLKRTLYEAVFDGHPYGRAVIGTPETIRSVSRSQLLDFYRRHYVPASFTLVVVGPVDPREIVAAGRRAFERLPRGDGRRLPAPPPTGAMRRIEISDRGAQACLGLAWPAARLDHADTPVLDLLVTILGRTRASRLAPTLLDGRALVTAISAGYDALEAAGVVWITTQLEVDRLASAEREILRQVARLRDEGVQERERRRATTLAEGRRQFEHEAVEGRAFALGHAETVWHLEDERAYIDRLRSVTLDQLRAAARRYLDPERYARVVVLPRTAP